MTPVIRPRAHDDIIRQFRWYLVEQDASDAAFRFLDAVEGSIKLLMLTPRAGAPREIKNSVLKGLRCWPVKGFEEFPIFYLVQGEMLRVVRVLHSQRDLNRILKKESADEDTLH